LEDNQNNKEMIRNQVVAFVLMIVALFAFMKFFPPGLQKKAAQQSQQQTAQTAPAATAPGSPSAPAAPNQAAPVLNPALPPIPEVVNPAEDEIRMADGDLHLTFTRIGARLKQAAVVVNGGALQPLVPEQAAPDTQAVYPMGLWFQNERLGEELNWRRWDSSVSPDNRSVTFSIDLPGEAVIRKTFTLSDKRHVVDVRVDYENLAEQPQVVGMDQTPAYYLYWGPNVSSNDDKMGIKQAVVWRKDGKVTSLPTASMKNGGGPFVQYMGAPDWLGLRSTYFLVAMKPGFESSQGIATGTPTEFKFGVSAPRFSIDKGAVQSNEFSVYVGPMERSALHAAWPTLTSALQFFQAPWGFMDWFAKVLLDILNWFYRFIPNYGLAIIFLTILVRVAMFPLTIKSMKSMKKMQMLAPELQALKEKYGENQQELNQKMLEMYRERGVNPMGGCLPMILQMPILFALYRMLWSAYELRGAPFMLWITDLSQPDKLVQIPALASIPLLGIFASINVLPILMALSMVLQNKFAPMSGPAQNSQQKMMMAFMPIFLGFVCYNMASGLNLYILISTLLGIAQQRFTWVGDLELRPKKKAVSKKQHFYAAAQARKRQMAKDAKRDKRRKA
jgi:YidC/Oxa1 family membrane protein insertase